MDQINCPRCGGRIEAFRMRRQELWAAMHRRRTDCPVEEFGRSEKGGTPRQAMERAQANLEALTKTTS